MGGRFRQAKYGRAGPGAPVFAHFDFLDQGELQAHHVSGGPPNSFILD